MTEQDKLNVARTILSQLGGSHFTTMVDVKNLCYTDKGLKLDFMRNPSKANQLVVNYDAGSDTYVMQFWKKGAKFNPDWIRKYTFEETQKKMLPKLIKEYENCYCDDLRRIFENTTKLRTSLTHIYGD